MYVCNICMYGRPQNKPAAGSTPDFLTRFSLFLDFFPFSSCPPDQDCRTIYSNYYNWEKKNILSLLLLSSLSPPFHGHLFSFYLVYHGPLLTPKQQPALPPRRVARRVLDPEDSSLFPLGLRLIAFCNSSERRVSLPYGSSIRTSFAADVPEYVDPPTPSRKRAQCHQLPCQVGRASYETVKDGQYPAGYSLWTTATEETGSRWCGAGCTVPNPDKIHGQSARGLETLFSTSK